MKLDGPSGTLRIVLAVLVGVGTMGYGAYSYAEQSSALDSAVTVEATITDTSVEERAGRGTTYSPRATFEFTYESERYAVTNLYPGPLPRGFGSEEKARAKLKGYEPGATVTAYVPEGSPEEAFLERESSDEPLLVVGFGALFTLGALFSAFRD